MLPGVAGSVFAMDLGCPWRITCFAVIRPWPPSGTSQKTKGYIFDEHDIDGDFVESQAFAYLAIRSFLNLPISFPLTTGCKEPCTGGVIVKNF